MRVALLTLEGLASATAVRKFVVDNHEHIAVVGLCNPFRGPRGGMLKQTLRHMRHSGLRFLLYLFVNFTLPRWTRGFWALRRGDRIEHTPLDVLCRQLGIPTVDVSDVNLAKTRQALTEHGAELVLTFHCDKILSAETIACFPRGGINVHAALLPLHRGPVPTLHALLDDVPRFGVTIHWLEPRIDAGPILSQLPVELPPRITALAAAQAVHLAALPCLKEALNEISAGRASKKQVEMMPYCGFPTRAEMCQLKKLGRRAADWQDFIAALSTPM